MLKITSDAASGTTDLPGDQRGEVIETSIRTLVERWYFRPLRQLDGQDDGFVLLLILFPVYERYLRYRVKMGDDEGFSHGHPALDIVGRHLGVSRDDAYAFWWHYRNGLLHHAMPSAHGGISFAIVRKRQFCVKREGNYIWVDPFMIRDTLLPILQEADKEMWRGVLYPLAKEFR